MLKTAACISNYLDINPVGMAYVAATCTFARETDLNSIKPDVCFVAKGRIPARYSGPIQVVPDLAVEIWSGQETLGTIQDKLDVYLETGVRLVWSIDLANQFVLVYHLNDQDIKLLNIGDELSGEDVLPGFTMPVKIFFE